MFRVAICTAGVLALTGCSDSCSNSVIRQADAPDGRQTAIMFQRDCGATTGFSTQISVLEPGTKLSGGGNAFRADTDHGVAASGDWGGPWADMRWIDSGTLLVSYASGARIFEQDQRVSGVQIDYQERAR